MGKLELILGETLDEPGTLLAKLNKFRNDISANENDNKIYQSVTVSHYEQQKVKLAINITELISLSHPAWSSIFLKQVKSDIFNIWFHYLMCQLVQK